MLTRELAGQYARRIEILLLAGRYEMAHTVIDEARLLSLSPDVDKITTHTHLVATSLSVRLVGRLERIGIHTIGQLLDRRDEIPAIRGIGENALDAINEMLQRGGFAK
jgi:DNA-directed RNA polymerase alpha subunit